MKNYSYSVCWNFCQPVYYWLLRQFLSFWFTLWFNDYPHGGNFIGLLVAVPIFISCVIGLGMLIGSLLDMPERAGHIIVFSSVPLFLLTGTAWPHHAMPEWLQGLLGVYPTHGVQMFVQLNQWVFL